MKITVTESMFCEQFKRVRPDNFSRAALEALFAHFEEMERDQGEEFELDVIEICCNWTEYASALEAAEAYGFKAKDTEDERADKSEDDAIAFLRDDTAILELSSGRIVVLNY
jgi:hypothetical protein